MRRKTIDGKLTARFESVAAAAPNRVAIVDGRRRLTFGDLSLQVRRYAAVLNAHGITERDRVGLLLPRSAEFAVAFLSLASIGAVAVPLDSTLTEEEIGHRLTGSRVKAMIASTAGQFQSSDLPALAAPVATGGKALLPSAAASPRSNPEMLLQYSSGTTAAPKSLVRTQANLAAEAEGFRLTAQVDESDVFLCALSLAHAHGLCNALISPLCAGARVVLLDSFVPREVLRTLEKERVTVFPTVPFLLDVLLRGGGSHRPDLSALRLCLSAGAPLRFETFQQFEDRFGVGVRQLYGSTETGAISMNLSPDARATWGSVGRPLSGVEVRIFEAAGSEGEIGVRSPFTISEYEESGADECGTAFREGFFLTGDRGRMGEHGDLYVVGRKKQMLTVAGKKVHPVEIENVLRRHPSINDAAVYGVAGKSGNDEVRAVVVVNSPCDEAEITRFCSRYLARHKIPRSIRFQVTIPRTPTGKLMWSAIAE